MADHENGPAAFGRLCVETSSRMANITALFQPPSGGCVLKQALGAEYKISLDQPPSGGCVLKL